MRDTMLCLMIGFTIMSCPGCSNSNTTKVHGTVTLDDEPISEVRVVFQPIQAGNNTEIDIGMGAYGVTDENGLYELQLVENNKSKIPIGDYRVRLLTFGDNTVLPTQARNGTLKITVPEGKDHCEDFSLELPKRGISSRGQLTTGKEPIETRRKILPRKTDNDNLPSRKTLDSE